MTRKSYKPIVTTMQPSIAIPPAGRSSALLISALLVAGLAISACGTIGTVLESDPLERLRAEQLARGCDLDVAMDSFAALVEHRERAGLPPAFFQELHIDIALAKGGCTRTDFDEILDLGVQNHDFPSWEAYRMGRLLLTVDFKDEYRAFQWMNSAAKKRHAKSQRMLVYMYLKGIGTPRDTVEALAWCRTFNQSTLVQKNPEWREDCPIINHDLSLKESYRASDLTDIYLSKYVSG